MFNTLQNQIKANETIAKYKYYSYIYLCIQFHNILTHGFEEKIVILAGRKFFRKISPGIIYKKYNVTFYNKIVLDCFNRSISCGTEKS